MDKLNYYLNELHGYRVTLFLIVKGLIMAVYTVRPDEDQELHVERLKNHYSEKAATKALLMAAADVPRQAQEIEQLKEKLKRSYTMLENYRESAKGITNGLMCFEIYEKTLKESERTNFITDQIEFNL